MRLLFLLLLSVSFTALSTQTLTYETTDSITHYWGPMTLADLESAPHPWLSGAPSAALADQSWGEGLQDLSVDIYLGTWCGDSKRLVPSFIQLWQQLGLETDQLHLIGLHNQGDNYKQGPADETLGMNIHRVPTFIFRRDGQEIGRIVERPLNDLETDLRQIALGAPSNPRYRAVHRMHELLASEPLDSIQANSRRYLRELYRAASGPGELNTYGYVLKAQGREAEALLVFRINASLFRYYPNCHDSLGELYLEQEEWELAKNCYEEVLRLKGEDEDALAALEEITLHLEEG
ncbi:MAG: thioredoxin family protein [Bacteroidota bacterium]